MDRRADKPHDLTEDETMSQTEKRLFLIRFLLGEQPGYRDIKITSDERKQRQLLRSLFFEAQFRRFFAEAERVRGVTGATLLSMLERRLDNVVYRLGFASSRTQGRQMVRPSLSCGAGSPKPAHKSGRRSPPGVYDQARQPLQEDMKHAV